MELQNFWVEMRECFYKQLFETPVQNDEVTASLSFLAGASCTKRLAHPNNYMEKINIVPVISHMNCFYADGTFYVPVKV